jgi:uncharacterized phiE125 gp8 family phage protein
MSATADPVTVPAESIIEAKAHLRLEGDGEDGLIARLIAAAIVACEGFTGTQLLIRAAREPIPISAEWRRLSLTPVQAITGVSGVATDGTGVVLPVDGYGSVIDGDGDGWVRVTQPGSAQRATVEFRAGRAETWGTLPEPLRQGIVRLAAHLYSHRDAADDSGPPAAVSALWRPWRRMRLR